MWSSETRTSLLEIVCKCLVKCKVYHCRHKLLSFVFRSHLSVAVLLPALNLYVFQLHQATCLFFSHTRVTARLRDLPCFSSSEAPLQHCFPNLAYERKPFLNPRNFFLPTYNWMQDRKFNCQIICSLRASYNFPGTHIASTMYVTETLTLLLG